MTDRAAVEALDPASIQRYESFFSALPLI
jgi:hypothetical protein